MDPMAPNWFGCCGLGWGGVLSAFEFDWSSKWAVSQENTTQRNNWGHQQHNTMSKLNKERMTTYNRNKQVKHKQIQNKTAAKAKDLFGKQTSQQSNDSNKATKNSNNNNKANNDSFPFTRGIWGYFRPPWLSVSMSFSFYLFLCGCFFVFFIRLFVPLFTCLLVCSFIVVVVVDSILFLRLDLCGGRFRHVCFLLRCRWWRLFCLLLKFIGCCSCSIVVVVLLFSCCCGCFRAEVEASEMSGEELHEPLVKAPGILV